MPIQVFQHACERLMAPRHVHDAVRDDAARVMPQVAYARMWQALEQDTQHCKEPEALALKAHMRHAFLSKQTALTPARACAQAAARVGAQLNLPNVTRVAEHAHRGLPGLDVPVVLAQSRALLAGDWRRPHALLQSRYRAAKRTLASSEAASTPECAAERLRLAAQALRTSSGHAALRVFDERGISPRNRLRRLKLLAEDTTLAPRSSEAHALHRCIAQLGQILGAKGVAYMHGVHIARLSLRQPVRAFDDADQLETMADKLVGSLFEIYDNLPGRAFESHLMQQVVVHMPASVCTAWQQFGVHMAHQWANLEPSLSMSIARQIAGRWGPEATRSWQNRAPNFQSFRAQMQTLGAQPALSAYLTSPVDSGDELLGRIYVLRDLALFMGPLADTSWGRQSIAYWTEVLEPRSGRLRDFSSWAQIPKRVGSGITATYQLQVCREGDIPAVMPNTLVCTDLHHPPVAALLRHGHVIAGGLSGSTNLLIGMYQHACASGMHALNEADFILATSAFMIYDGGHSLAEVMWPIERRMGPLNDGARDHEVGDYEIWLERVGGPQFVQDAQNFALHHM